jgi:predicted ATPase/class 3 adenylate cyclase
VTKDSRAELESRLADARVAGRTRLPAQPTRFLGRDRELGEVRELLARDEVRLVTLTGPGGIGKTRLAVQAASDSAARYGGGVAFVALAPIREGEFIASTVVDALGLADQPGLDPERLLLDHLATRELLLVLDNLEQLADGAAFVARLLSECPGLTVLAVSRGALRLSAEQRYPVPTLDDGDAVALFVERARAVRPGFTFEPEVVDICRRLDALPLAIELAAARMRALSAAQILTRLDRRLPLLTGGPRDAPERQRTLRAAIDWSHDLMSADEQALFARLGVFVGGFTFDAVEGICDGDVETLLALLDKSLVRFSADRYAMLETIGEYARERLAERGDTEVLRARHLRWFVELAERAAPQLRSDQQDRFWLDALEVDRDNLRAALRWSVDGGHGESAQRLVAALFGFWHDRGPAGEARDWFAQALALPAADETRAAALTRGSLLAMWAGDWAHARDWAREGIELASRTGDSLGVVTALTTNASLAVVEQRPADSLTLLEEALPIARETGDEWAIAVTIASILSAHTQIGAARRAALADEAAGLRHISATARAMIQMCRGFVAEQRGDDEEAVSLYRDSVALARELSFGMAAAPMLNLAMLQIRGGELEEARDLLYEAIDRAMAAGLNFLVAGAVAYLSVLAAADGDPTRAATLRGAVERYRETVADIGLTEFQDGTFDEYLASAREAAGAAAWGRAFERGHALSIDEAVALATSERTRFDPHAAADGTLTIMFSDIVGSTAMIERLGDRRWLEVLRTHDAIVCREVEFHRGGVVKSRGDGFMLAFSRARDALACAVAIQHAFAEHNAVRADAPIRVRVGAHTGTAIPHEHDYHGRDVNLAARVVDRAAADEILVTEAVRESVGADAEFVLVPRDVLDLKGIPGRHAAYAVAWRAGRRHAQAVAR